MHQADEVDEYEWQPAKHAEGHGGGAKSDSLPSCGFDVGSKVSLTKRITVEFKDSDSERILRKDFNKEFETFVVGCDKTWPVLEFTAELDKANIVQKQRVNPKALKVVSASTLIPENPGAKAKVVPKKFAFVKNVPEGGKVTPYEGWHKSLPMCYDDTKIQYAKDLVNFNLRVAESLIAEHVQAYDSTDFAIVEKCDATVSGNPKIEVWTLKAFDPHAIVLLPDTHAVLDRMYTQNRSSLVRGGDKLHPQKKQLVLDGRLRNKPNMDSRPFSLFFVVDRTEEPSAANLHMGVISPKIDFKMSIAGGTNLQRVLDGQSEGVNANVGIPYMFNPKKIEKHTCLFALHEPELSKLAAKEVEDKKAQAKTASIALEEVNKKKAADKVEKKKQGKHDDK
jgi:hypothetical protein